MMYLHTFLIYITVLTVVFFVSLWLFDLVGLEEASAWATVITLLSATYISFGLRE